MSTANLIEFPTPHASTQNATCGYQKAPAALGCTTADAAQHPPYAQVEQLVSKPELANHVSEQPNVNGRFGFVSKSQELHVRMRLGSREIPSCLGYI